VAQAPPTAGRAKVLRRSSFERRRNRAAYAFLAPALVILAVFVGWPIIDSLRLSFTNARIIGPAQWIGLDNWSKLIADSRFWNDLGNTVLYAVVTAPISIALALVFAMLLNGKIPARGFFRSVLFFPFVASISIVSIAWAFLLDPQVGTLAAWLSDVGLPIGNGIRSPEWAMPAVMLVGIWRNTGFFMVMYLAGLQSIPSEIYEAAELDGARGWKRFRSIVWPLLSNTTFFVVTIATIFSFQAFDQMYVMTDGGPFFKTETLVMYLYSAGFEDFDIGYASTISWALVIVVLVLSLGQQSFFNKRAVQY
jgi:multiple sugar transport system permease protein